MPVFKQALRKAILVEALEDILVQQIAEDVNNFVKNLVEFKFLDCFEVFLEHLIEVEHKCFRCSIVLVHNLFEREFDGQLNLRISFHSLSRNLNNAVSQSDQLTNKVFVFDLLITNEFVAFFDDEVGETLSELFK